MRKNIEYISWMILALSLIGLMIFCIYPNEKMQSIRVYFSIFCVLIFFISILLHYCVHLFSYFSKWYHKKVEYILRIISTKCISIGDRIEAKLVKPQELDLLSPTILKDSKYVELLKSALDNERVSNIAITGSYGSGKSSIINTFQYLYPEYKCLNLSLASFAEEQELQPRIVVTEKDGVKTTETIPNPEAKVDIEKLEYSLVQQFFYHVKANRIPDSRFGRILRISRVSKIIIALCIVIILVSTCILLKHEQLVVMFPGLRTFLESAISKYLSVTALVSGLLFVFYKAVGYVCNLNSGQIKLMNYEIGLQKDMEISIFNRYLDELVYMFQRTGYEVVVLEDLDRFKNTSIFTKLRELNLLLNQAKDIDRRIVFVYALRDDVFRTASDRTKFFDYIIPVIPHVNVSNSASSFVEKFEGLIRENNNEPGLDKSFLADVAPFIGDFRVIKAIVSEFDVVRHFLDEDLDLNNLLAMVIYKNLYPQDCEKLHEGKGPIKEIFDGKNKLIEDERKRIQEEISNIEKEIRASELENLRSVEELRAVVLAAAARCIPNGYSLCNSSNNFVTFAEINTDEEIAELLQGHYRSKQPYYNYRANITKDDMLNILGEGFDYNKRKKQIEHKTSVTGRKLKTHRESLQKRLDALLQKSVCELCLDNPYLLQKSGLCKDNNLLEFLIRKGYIDEKYFYYITIFKEGLLSSEDNDYLMAIKSLGASEDDEFGKPIDDPNSLLRFLISSDFKSDKILNFELVHAIITGNDESQKKLLIGKLAEGGTLNLDFISRYAVTGYVDDGLLRSVAASYPNLWIDVVDETLFSNEARLNLFTRLMHFADLKDIENMNSDGQMEEFLSQQYYEYTFKGMPTAKARDIIKALNPCFDILQDDRQSTGLFNFVYENGYYKLNKPNVVLILNIFGENSVDEYEGAIYSAIKDSNITILNQQVEASIAYFVDTLVLADGNVNEHEDAFIMLLNNEKITLEAKQKLILHNASVIKSIEEVNDGDLQDMLYRNIKVEASFKNIRYYYQERGLAGMDELLCKFINANEDAFIKVLGDEYNADDLQIIKQILFAPIINEDIAKAILDNEKYKNLWMDELGSLKGDLVGYLIGKKNIDFSVERFKSIGTAHEDLYTQLLKEYAREVIDNLEEYAFSTDNLLILLNYPEYLPYKHNLVSVITPEALTTAMQANKLLDYYASTDSVFEHNLYYKALELSDNRIKKMIASTEYIKRGFLLQENYNMYFALMGDGFESLTTPGETFTIRKGEEAESFINALEVIGILGHRTDSKTEFKAYVKKR